MPLPRDLPGRPDERVMRQLVAALLFEGLVEAHCTAASTNGAMSFSWSSQDVEFRCRGSRGPFGRLRIEAGSIQARVGDGRWTAARLEDIAGGLPGCAEHREQLLREMQQTVAFCQWNADRLTRPTRRGMTLGGLEGALDEGHPYHPCFKARTGFSDRDHEAFGPEAGNGFQLVWLLVARRHLRQSLPSDEAAFFAQELGASVWSALQARRDQHDLSDADFGFLPLHPWQWADLAATRLAPWIEAGQVVCVGEAGDRYTASQSLRTVLNADHPERANVKLAMNVVNTSSRRTLEPHSVCTAPVLSQWIGDIVASDALFCERYPLAILKEYAGIIADGDGPLAGQLAAIWRQSADATLSPGEAVVPFNALMMVEDDGFPFVDDWIALHGLMPWLNRLIEVAVLPVWHLLVAHGMAVEAHGQNMLLVHRNGWPVRLILRDFHESIEYAPGFLRDPGRVPDFAAMNPLYRSAAPDQFYWTDNLDSLRELVMDTLFVYNFSEISDLFALCYGLPETQFWSRIDSHLLAYAAEHGMAGRQSRLGSAAPQILTESLLTRKLFAARPEYHHRVGNALAADRTERRRKP